LAWNRFITRDFLLLPILLEGVMSKHPYLRRKTQALCALRVLDDQRRKQAKYCPSCGGQTGDRFQAVREKTTSRHRKGTDQRFGGHRHLLGHNRSIPNLSNQEETLILCGLKRLTFAKKSQYDSSGISTTLLTNREKMALSNFWLRDNFRTDVPKLPI
jgi:hypothetical protein